MKKLFITIMACLAFTCVRAQGWPANYGGVMLQGFYWDYYDDADWGTWSALEGQADDLEGYIDLIWVPNSARTKNDYCVEHAATEGNGWLKDMGYMPCWWLDHDNTIFGNSAELKSMIATYKSKGIGIIEDVVINHKNGENSWCDFPNEKVTVGDKTYELNWSLADICRNDNGGYVSTMFNVTGANDTGDDFDGCRDLDHTGANVQQNVITYLNYLKDELGYSGFRYDMVKGYNPVYVGIYNAAVNPEFSVGEFWDDWGGTTWWVNGTTQNYAVQSAAFDFPLKFLINNAFTGNFNQSALNTQGMAGDDFYKRYSVTFVDNHDTYRDGTCMSNEKHVLAANAFILSMPGTPCIFLPHWKTHKDALKRMIKARKLAGITNQSSFDSYVCNNGNGRSFIVHGNNADILLLLGDCGSYNTSGYSSVWNGDVNNWDFQMFVSESVADALNNRIRVDKASGTYYQSVTVNVSPSDNSMTLVYTTDGNEPTTESPIIDHNGKEFVYENAGTYTLKVGVKDGESVTDIQTFTYTITMEQIPDVTIYVRADKDPIYLYAWKVKDNNTIELTSSWPGTKLSEMKSIDGVNFYCMTIPKPTDGYVLKYILSQGNNTPQTEDIVAVGSTIFTALGNINGQRIETSDMSDFCEGKPIESPVYKDITVYVKATQGGMKLHAWNASGDLTSGQEKLTDVILVKDCAWYRKTFTNQNLISFLVYSDDINNSKSNDYVNVTSDVFVTYNGYNSDLTNSTDSYSGYTPAWYEQGEICAFFVDDVNDNEHPNREWGNIHAWAWIKGGNNYTGGEWPGAGCEYLGFNEWGQKIYKWTYTGDLTGTPEYIIFNNGKSGSDEVKTADCQFINGAWYNTSNTEENTSPISTAVAPNTDINLTDLGTATTTKNWNGKSEKVAEMTNSGTGTMSKTVSLTAGDYIVQAIVRGANGGIVNLSVSCKKEENASVNLTGLDGASTVQTNGIVDKYETGTNNGWQKVELSFAHESNEDVTITLTSGAETWQLGSLKILSGSTVTKAPVGTYVDVSAENDFSFYERGENRNALTKAAAGTLPALLPYNVIVNGICANLKLSDASNSEHNYCFYAGDAFTATNVSYDRPFTINQTSTVCLPFALTAKEADEAGTFWGLESYNSETGELNFVKVDAPEANTPYLFDAKVSSPFTFLTNKIVPVSSSLTTEITNGISFNGVNERTHLVSGKDESGNSAPNVIYYGYRNSDHSFVKVGTGEGQNGGGAWINPFRAYIKTVSSNTGSNTNARLNVLFDGEGGETGIQVVKPAVEPKGKQPIFNLSGQRVMTPNKKGIYVIGGKKYIVK